MHPPLYAPVMGSVLRLPDQVIVGRVVGMAALAVGGSIAVRWGLWYYLSRASLVVTGFTRHPRCGPSLWLNMCLTGAISICLQAVYRNVRFLPTAVEAVVKGLRVCAGMEARAPYTEMVGGSAVKEVAAAVDTVYSAVRIPRLPHLTIFGVNPRPMTAGDHAELFGNGDAQQKFHTPARFLNMAIVAAVALGVARVVRNGLLMRMVSSITPPQPTVQLTSMLIAAPAAVYQALLLSRDEDSVWGVPVSTVLVGLYVANVYIINTTLNSREKSPPSEADIGFGRAMALHISQLHLHYCDESFLQEHICQWFLRSVKRNWTDVLAGIVSMVAFIEALDAEVGVDPFLNEFGITRIGTLEEIWEAGTNPPSGLCPICSGGMLAGYRMAQMPCCEGYVHDECIYGLLKQRHRACPLCTAPCPRTIPDVTKNFIISFDSMSEGDQSLSVKHFAMEESVATGKLFGFIHPDSNSPLPYTCLTAEEMLRYIVNHPAPTPFTKQAASGVGSYVLVGAPMQCAYWVSMLVCPTLEDHLLPMSLHNEESVTALYRFTPTPLGRCLAFIGGLLHFYIVS